MSGGEVATVLGVISSIISIVDQTKKLFEAAKDQEGLPEVFREVANRLPIIENILDYATQNAKAEDVTNEGVEKIVEACEDKAHKLRSLFRKVMPAEGAKKGERYLAAIKTLGKGSRVELLMKGMLEDVQLLASARGMKTITHSQHEELSKAIKEVSDISTSEIENTQDGTITNIHNGMGSQKNVGLTGNKNQVGNYNKLFNQSGKYSAETMHFRSGEDSN